MKINLDLSACTGHGRCYALAPDVFTADDQGHAELIDSSGAVADDLVDQAHSAIANCPEQAITGAE